MGNLVLFANSFLSYLLVFVIAVVLLFVGCFIGIKWRKTKDAKAALAEAEGTAETE